MKEKSTYIHDVALQGVLCRLCVTLTICSRDASAVYLEAVDLI